MSRGPVAPASGDEIAVEPVESAETDAASADDANEDDLGEAAEPIEVTVTDRSDLETEPDPEGPLEDGPSYVLYGGKGGVGKTTMAAATALDAARRGRRTLVISTDPAHSLSDAFETDVPARPEPIHPEYPLFGVEIDPDAAASETMASLSMDLEAHGPEGLAELFGEDSPMGPSMGAMAPGTDEIVAMQLLLEYLDDDRFELVVVDTAPTGHTLRLLELPELLETMTGRLLRFRERLGSMLEGMSGLFGGGGEPDEFEDDADLEALREQVERLRTVLRDPALTDFRIVVVPEELGVRESERLLAQLEEYGIPVGTIVVNRVMEPIEDVLDEADLEGLDVEYDHPDLEGCAFCQRRWSVQQGALAAAQDLFRGHEVKRVPLLAEEVRGERMLRVVGACLR